MATTPELIQLKLKTFNNFQMRAMLDAAGCKKLPSGKSEIITMFLSYLEDKPDAICKAYDFVILKKIPEGGASVPVDATAFVEQVKKELATKANEHATTIGNAIKTVFDVEKKNLDSVAAEAIKRAAESATPRIIEVRSPGKEPKKLKGTLPAEFDRILRLAMARKNTMMIGPAGCGKTFIGEKVAEALGLKFSSVSCTSGMGESELKGWLLPTGDHGRFEYVQSQFIERYENGGVFLLDEIDASDPNVLVFINQALANGSFFLAQRFANPKVVKHPDFVCLAAANTFGHGADMMYVGRNQLDAATLDRFRAGIVTMDYDPKVEEALIHPDVLVWGRAIRQKIREHKLRRLMTMRAMIDISDMIKMHGLAEWPKAEWERSYFADWSADEIRRVKGGL